MTSQGGKRKRLDSGDNEIHVKLKHFSSSERTDSGPTVNNKTARTGKLEYLAPSGIYKRSSDEEESVFVAADKVFRLQVDWMVEHAGVRKEFPDIMRRLWWSYLAKALPDVSCGIEKRLIGDGNWMQKLRDVDLAHLLDIPVKKTGSMRSALEKKQKLLLQNAAVKTCLGAGTRRGESYWRDGDWAKLFMERLTRYRLPALIVLGLHLCQEHTLISDIIRWIRCHQYPFLNPGELCNEEFMRSFKKALDMTSIPATPSYPQLEYQVVALAKLLGVKESEFSATALAPVLARFVEELNLPKSMIGFVMALATTLHTTEVKLDFACRVWQGNRRSDCVEVFCMCCIIYAMRIMFGMDGQTETTISDLTVSLQELISADQKLFNFKQWVRHMDLRRLQLYRHTYLLPQSTTIAETFLQDSGPVQLRPVGTAFESGSLDIWRMNRRLAEVVDEKQSDKLIVVLPPTHRPFRAHTEALARTYPALSVDFTVCHIEHLLCQKVLPDQWNLSAKNRKKAYRLLVKVFAAQKAAKNSFPYRAQTVLENETRTMDQSAVVDEFPSVGVRWLVEICAEIIEQLPDRLVRGLTYLELALFPANQYSRNFGGSARIMQMRHG